MSSSLARPWKRLFLSLLWLGWLSGCTSEPPSVFSGQPEPEWLARQDELWQQAVDGLDASGAWPASVRSASLSGERLAWIEESEGVTVLLIGTLKNSNLGSRRKLLSRDHPQELLSVALSPDGSRAVLQSQSGETEDLENGCSLELLDIENGKTTLLSNQGSRYLAPLWCGPESLILGELQSDAVSVFRQTIGGSRRLILLHQAPYARLLLQRLEPHGWMLVDRNQPQNLHCWITSRDDASSGWEELSVPGQRGRVMGWLGESLVVVARDTREQGRVLLVDRPLKAPLSGRLVRSTGALEYAFLSGRLLFYITSEGWGHALRKLDLQTGQEVDLELPFGPVQAAAFQPSGPGRALLPLQGPFQPPALYLVSADSARVEPLLVPRLAWLDRDRFEVRLADGEVRIGSREARSEAPVLLESYGAFGEVLAPVYDPLRLEWLRLGGQVKLAQIVAEPRQQDRTVDMLLAAARSHSRVAYRGQSFGATLGLMAMQREPAAFQAVLADAPLTDLVHFGEQRPGELWLAELGDVRDPGDAKRLRRLSPLHNLTESPYPLTVLTIARDDPTVDWRHATSYAQLARVSGEQTLFRLQRVGAHDRLRPSDNEQAQLACLLWRAVAEAASRDQDSENRKRRP